MFASYEKFHAVNPCGPDNIAESDVNQTLRLVFWCVRYWDASARLGNFRTHHNMALPEEDRSSTFFSINTSYLCLSNCGYIWIMIATYIYIYTKRNRHVAYQNFIRLLSQTLLDKWLLDIHSLCVKLLMRNTLHVVFHKVAAHVSSEFLLFPVLEVNIEF